MLLFVLFRFLATGKFFNCHLTGIIEEKKAEDDEDDEYIDSTRRVVRSSTIAGSDSDSE